MAALLIRLLPPLLLLSRRFDEVWPNLAARFLLSTVYICLPNSYESLDNVTNSQWHLALAGFLLLTSSPGRTRIGRIGDLLALTLCCVSGPFCLMLLPIGVWSWATTRSPEARDRLLCIVGWTSVQGYFLMQTAVQTRSYSSLGVGVATLARILAVQVLLGLLLGLHITSRLARTTLFEWVSLMVSLAVLGLAVCAVATWKGSDLFRKFALFGALVLASSLLSPVVSLETTPAWIVLGKPGAGQRYFLIPMLVLAAAGMTLASFRPSFLRRAGAILCASIAVGVATDFHYPRMPRTDFNSQARQFDQAPIGTEMAFQIYPLGYAPMVLVKR